ncbi:MFS transporter [Saccharopolyspora sp. NPDC003752]
MPREAPPKTEPDVGRSALRKATRRIIPILMAGYIISYLDRINISFAKFGMEESFGMSATAYGFAAGVFFIGYVLFEVPSNMMMRKVGARLWISRIMISWGLIAAAMGFVHSAEWIYVLRFLLGVAEAGFFPGIILYLTYWYPAAQHTKIISTLMMSIPISGAISGPINGWILDTFDGAWGMEGWRWVFIIGGVPAVLLGVVFLATLTNKPAQAKWLTPAERDWLTDTVAAEEQARSETAPKGHAAVFRDKKVLALALVYFLLQCGAYPLTYWMPSVIDDVGQGLTPTQLGWLTAVPFAFAAIAMYLVGRLVRKEGSAVPVAIALGISVLGFAGTATTLSTPMLAFLLITIATMAAQTSKPLFWPLSTLYLSGAAAASGIALINSLGNAAGFISPYAVGWIQDASGGNNGLSMIVMITANLFAVIIVALLSRSRKHA